MYTRFRPPARVTYVDVHLALCCARIVTPRSIPELFFIVAVNPAVLEEGSEHTCFAEVRQQRIMLDPPLSTSDSYS